MSTIDPLARPSARPDAVRSVGTGMPASELRHATFARRMDRAEDATGRSRAQEVLTRMAERALEHPPRDIQKLTASAAKFLITDLEPALELARKMRTERLSEEPIRTIEILAKDRHQEALSLLAERAI